MLKANILITNGTPPRARISDFGLSAIVGTPAEGAVGGTIGWMAPELLLPGDRVSKEADMYAFGMVVYEVIAGVRPYGLYEAREIQTLTIQGWRPPRPNAPMPAGFGQGTWEFVERCWDGNSIQRPSARAALEHFERVTRTSTVVDPSPALRVQEGASKSHCKCHGRGAVTSL